MDKINIEKVGDWICNCVFRYLVANFIFQMPEIIGTGQSF